MSLTNVNVFGNIENKDHVIRILRDKQDTLGEATIELEHLNTTLTNDCSALKTDLNNALKFIGRLTSSITVQ